MPLQLYERAAVEKRLAQISIELGFDHLSPGQRVAVELEQSLLRNAIAEQSFATPSENGEHRPRQPR
jgi:hypothetical protein